MSGCTGMASAPSVSRGQSHHDGGHRHSRPGQRSVRSHAIESAALPAHVHVPVGLSRASILTDSATVDHRGLFTGSPGAARGGVKGPRRHFRWRRSAPVQRSADGELCVELIDEAFGLLVGMLDALHLIGVAWWPRLAELLDYLAQFAHLRDRVFQSLRAPIGNPRCWRRSRAGASTVSPGCGSVPSAFYGRGSPPPERRLLRRSQRPCSCRTARCCGASAGPEFAGPWRWQMPAALVVIGLASSSS